VRVSFRKTTVLLSSFPEANPPSLLGGFIVVTVIVADFTARFGMRHAEDNF
jgi:hypothetical protein